jgi:Domain of unknown function (DUF4214)
MANVQVLATSGDMRTSSVVFGTAVSHDANRIDIVAGSVESIYTGSFSYPGTGEVFGTLTGLTTLGSGSTSYVATGLNMPAIDATHLIQAGQMQGFFQEALAGNDQFEVYSGTHVLDGYGGFNTVTETQAHANYTISTSNGTTVVSSPGENDTLFDFQRVIFADGSYDTASQTFTFSASSGFFTGSSSVIDTVVVPDFLRQNLISGLPSSTGSLSGPAISDQLSAIDRLQFIDGTMYYDVGSPAAAVARMYQAALGRAPDPVGLSAWVTSMQAGASIVQLANGFIGSAEFQTRFPGAAQSALAFVTQLYANVLHRAPDAGGLGFWVNQLQTGAQTQAQVLAGFSESLENQTASQLLMNKGLWVADEQTASVARLYYAALARTPDANGLSFWASRLHSGATTLTQEANSFTASAEFQGKYGTLSNADFVGLLYHNVLGRAADSTGAAFWTGLLNTGATRAGVLLGFSDSQENQNAMMPRVENAGVSLA